MIHFRTLSGHLKDSETVARILTLSYYSVVMWSEKENLLHRSEDTMIEGWAQGVVVFLNDEEWQALMKQLATEKEKANQYVS